MRHKRIATFLVVGMILVTWSLLAAPVWAQQQQYDVYKNVPDVDKPDRDANGIWPDPGDMSCWQATAANLLGGAGWGLAANTPQQNADAIYGHMNTHFGWANSGKPEIAINWWLYNYGYNSDQAGSGWYQPTKTYNDVTVINRTLCSFDYDFLLDELERCQYVGVSWEFFDPVLDVGFAHCLTLIGGNHVGNPNARPTGNVSLWHDSDRDVGNGVLDPVNDDQYTNTFDLVPPAALPHWHINYTAAVPQNWALGYVTLCPGEQKPASALENYDAAWHRDYNAAGSEIQVWRTAGANKNWGDPTWDPDATGDYTTLEIPNEEIEKMFKMVYLLVDFKDRLYDPADPDGAPDIKLEDDGGNEVLDLIITISADGGQILYEWKMDDQPPFERIIFPNTDYYYLTGDIKDFNIATECVPEPATMGLLVLGGIGLLIRRKRN